MIQLMKRILAVSGRYKERIQIAFVFSFLKSLLAKAPIMLAFLVLSSFYEGTITAGDCLWYGIALVVCVLLQVLFHHIADRLQSAAGFLVFSDMRMDLGAHLRRMPMGYFTEGNIGKISSVLSSDMVFIEENCMTVLADMMSYIFAQAILVVFLLCFDLWIGLAALAIIGIVLLIARGMKREALQDSVARQEQNENLTEAVLDFVEGIGIIKTYNLLGEKSRELTDNFQRSCDTSLQFEEDHSPWQLRLNLAYGLGAAAITAIALALESAGLMSVPYLVGIMLFVFDLFGPIKALYTQATRLTVMNSCMDRIEEVFHEPELPDDGRDSIPDTGEAPEVEFQHVRFAYGEKEVLHDISFYLPRRQMLALVGPSGGGKSTIANLLTRFWDVKDGRVLVRGKDVREVKLADLMDHISMVFQRVYLFQDTIYNNIAMGRPDATREEVLEAARKARCYDFVMALPDGFDTVIGEGGASLSGGERQRISIARALLKNAPIVLLDEATASLDVENETKVQGALSRLLAGKTVLVIAHRMRTVAGADRIVVLDNGRVAEQGTPAELMARGGLYRRMVELQSQSAQWQLNQA